jgi:3-deoxy-D-manno-octulosonic-acid transferase
MRTLYSVLFYTLIPFILLRLIWRSIKAPDYRLRWKERFGYYDSKFPQGVIWFHAVSVGEAEAIFPLIRRIQKLFPNALILITTTTPTGSARVRSVMGKSVAHVYLPYDIPFAIKRFYQCFKPVVAVIVETEIWPNLYHYCGNHKIPLYLINARLSERSTGRYKKIPSLIHPTLTNLKMVATQTEEDTQRFAAIGVPKEKLITSGNIKFDVEISQEIIEEGMLFKSHAFSGRFVWLAASTHRGEEQLCLDIYKELKDSIPGILLIIVPRHPERFDEVRNLCERNQLNVVNRTSKNPCKTITDVYLADTMGELKLLYAATDLAFIGGSMVEVGGHNLLEATAAGVPVMFGPYMANFKEIAEKVVAYEAAIACPDKEALTRTIEQLYSDTIRRSVLVENGKKFLQKNRGVTEKLVGLISRDFG